MHIGIHRVIALLLQFVGSYLVHQSDTATFLLHVDEHAFTFTVYHLHGLVQLFAAVAALAAQDVAGGAR